MQGSESRLSRFEYSAKIQRRQAVFVTHLSQDIDKPEVPMRIIRQFGLILLTSGFAVALSAQSRPNFSGKWTLESSKPSGAAMVRSSQVVKHDANTLWVGQSEGGHHSSTYTLDAKPHETMIGPVKSVSKAEWNGNKLVIDRTDTFPTGAARTMKEVWSLGTSGQLVIVLTDKREGKDELTMTNVYIKK